MLSPMNWLSALANHLWQSTAFAAAAWLLALALRRNHARTRYWIWLCASLKFLFPLSLLFVLGQSLRPVAFHSAPHPEFSAAIAQVAQPFADASVALPASPVMTAHPANFLPVALAIVWLCGVVGVASGWWLRWRRVRTAVHAAAMLHYAVGVPILFSPTQIEPGIFGIFRPVLLMPQGIARRLTPEQMDAVLAHEMCHVRRRDNLTGAIHMLVAAAFWFHPLVWWIGARLVEERERACDEEVLRLGRQRETYAESILSVCKHYVESPIPCISGISGSDLKKRIVRIMTPHFSQNLTLARKILVSAVALVAVTGPLALGVLAGPGSVVRNVRLLYLRQGGPAYGGSGPQPTVPTEIEGPLPTFEVASIKVDTSNQMNHGFSSPDPSQLRVISMPAKGLIEYAYGLKDFQLTGGPSWVNSTQYDVDAKVEDSLAASMLKMSRNERQVQQRLMIRSLLRDRFKLTVSHETKDEPEYALVVAKGQPKLTPTAYVAPDPSAPRAKPLAGDGPHLLLSAGKISGVDQPVSALCELLAFMPEIEGHLVVDQTGITGNYDYTVTFSSSSLGNKFGQTVGAAPQPDDDSGLSIFTALQEQLGLKLEMTKGPVDVYNIDHIEQPTEN